MRERKQANPRLTGDESCFAGRRVERLAGPLSLVGQEGRLVDEQVRAGGRIHDRRRRSGVAGEHDLPPRSRRAEHLHRDDLRPVREGHRLAPLEETPLTSVGDPECVRGVHVEAPGTLALHERIPDRGHAVVDGERLQPVPVALECVARLKLDGFECIRQPPEDPAERGEEVAQPARAVDGDRQLAPSERERLEHPWQAEIVIGVVVGEEDLAQLDEADVAAQELPLRSLRAIEQEPLATPTDQGGREGPLRGWRRAGRPDEDDVEVHGAECRLDPMGERLQGGRLAAQAIVAEGIDVVFTLSGGHVMPIYEGCRHEGVRVVDLRHEQSAAHAAEAWGRVKRACGVALVTAGPGVTGTVTAIANCLAAQTPLVVLGGARPLAQAEQGALQEFDQLSLMKPITKWAAVCPSASRIPEYVAIAFRHALAAPRGPVYLELPADILFEDAEADRDPAPSRVAPRAFGDPRELTKAADLLNAAERPAVIAGSGIWWDDAATHLAAFAENGRLPIFLNGSGRGSLPPEHELFFQHARSAALAEADVVCVVGTPLDFRLRFGRFGDGKLIHIHGDPRELGRNRVPDAAIVGDCAAVLGILADAVETPADGRRAWLERLRNAEGAWWDENKSELESDASPVHHYRLGTELDRVLDAGTVVIGDGGDVVAAASRVLRVHRPGHWLDPGPFGCLGVGPGYAVGVCAASFGSRVVCVLGDGAFGLNGLDFDTLVRFSFPAVLVIGNDGAWGEIRVPQVGIYGDEGEIATRLAPSRYDRLCEVFGGHAEYVERPSEIAPALERALASGQPAIVNVLLDPDAMAGHAYRGL